QASDLSPSAGSDISCSVTLPAWSSSPCSGHTPPGLLESRSAPPPGLEPGLSEPKSEVLPITLRRIAPGQDIHCRLQFAGRSVTGVFDSPQRGNLPVP